MTSENIDDFYFVTSEVLCQLYTVFPVRHLLLVEDLIGPIQWDITGLPDRNSQACFETLIWLSAHDLLTFRTIEPRNIGIEGAVLTQKAFVLLTGTMTWESGGPTTRVEALREARHHRAYSDLGAVVNDLLRANCQWAAPSATAPLSRAAAFALVSEGD